MQFRAPVLKGSKNKNKNSLVIDNQVYSFIELASEGGQQSLAFHWLVDASLQSLPLSVLCVSDFTWLSVYLCVPSLLTRTQVILDQDPTLLQHDLILLHLVCFQTRSYKRFWELSRTSRYLFGRMNSIEPITQI
jgi:hypothetical protein